MVGLGGGEGHVELLENQLEEFVSFVAVEVSATVLVEGSPDIVYNLADAS